MQLEGDSRNPIAYLAYDLMTGNFLGEFPFQGVKISQRLNTPGEFTGTLNYLDPRVKAMTPGQLLQPGRTMLFVDYLGTLLWGGILWLDNFSRKTASAVQWQGKECWSYFESRNQAKDYTLPTWTTATVSGTTLCGDPMEIAYQVVNDSIGKSHSGFGASTGFPLTINLNNGSGTPEADWVYQSYPITQLQTVDQIITNLSQMGWQVGFDFGIDVAYDEYSFPTLTLNLSYPRRGRTGSVDSVVIVTQAAHDYSYPQDATNTGNTICATGSGSATQVSVSNSAPIDAGWPLLEQTESYTNISTTSALKHVAQGDLVTQSWPIATPQVTIPMFGDIQPYEYLIGDDVKWTVEPDERFPNGMSQYWRIGGIDWTIADDGISTALLTFNQPPGSSLPQPPT